MPLFTGRERRAAVALAELAFVNPFLPRRIELERGVLGPSTVGAHAVMHKLSGLTVEEAFPHLPRLGAIAEGLASTARERLAGGRPASDSELGVYQDVALYSLYAKYAVDFDVPAELDSRTTADLWDRFSEDFRFLLRIPGRRFERDDQPAHVLACYVQIWRAFRNIFDCIVGASAPVTSLRASVWQSIFTHDLRRYGRSLFATLADIPTLVTGPSGTGKELVAKAIALSAYVPFDPQTKAFDSSGVSLHTVNLSALSPTLVESELFGHVRGSFTGAVRDRKGWLEECGDRGAVFLDEIGELDPAIQVKLLRVIQERRFQRLGDTRDLPFRAKIISATNRDLAYEMRRGLFREDLYYRLCGDIVATPSLREQLDDTPGDLANLVRFIVTHQLQFDSEVERESVTDEVLSIIADKLPPDYPWPGNFRELEQCVRNILIRRDYRPPTPRGAGSEQSPEDEFNSQLSSLTLSSDELLRYYYTLVYKNAGSYKDAARILQVDWRTVRDKVESKFLEGPGSSDRSNASRPS